MAKKKRWGTATTPKLVKPAKGKPPAKGKASKASVKRKGKAAPKPGRAKAQPLPGMEDMRIAELDDYAGQLADIRHDLNDLQARENELNEPITRALLKHGKSVWVAHGMELSLVATGQKLRKRVVKDRSERSSTSSTPEPEEKPSRASGRKKKDEAPEQDAPEHARGDDKAFENLMGELGDDDVIDRGDEAEDIDA